MATSNLDILIKVATRGVRNIQGLNKDLKALDQQNLTTQDKLKNLGKVALGVGAAFGTMLVAGKVAFDELEKGAALELSRDRFDRLAESIDSTSDAMMVKLRSATRGMVSDAELVASAGEIISLGLADTEDGVVRLANLVAQLGWDMQQVILTFANNSKMRLDALGLSVADVEDKMRALEASGMDADKAFDMAVIQAGEEKLALLGSAADTTAGKLQWLKARGEDVHDTFSLEFTQEFVAQLGDTDEAAQRTAENMIYLAGAAGRAVGALGGVTAELAQEMGFFARVEQLRQQGMGFGEIFSFLSNTPGIATAPTEDITRLFNEQMDDFLRARDVLKATRAHGNYAAMFSAEADALKEEAGAVQIAKIGFVDLGTAKKGVIVAAEELTRKTQAHEDALKREEEAMKAAAEAQEALREARAHSGDLFMESVRTIDEIKSLTKFDLPQFLWDSADAAGFGADELADYGMELGLINEDVAQSAIELAELKLAIEAANDQFRNGITGVAGWRVAVGQAVREFKGEWTAGVAGDDALGQQAAYWDEVDQGTQDWRESIDELQDPLSTASQQLEDIRTKTLNLPEGEVEIQVDPDGSAERKLDDIEARLLEWANGIDVPINPYIANGGEEGQTTSGGGGRAMGGSVFGGTPYIVGERGPELFVPSRSGTIVPNEQMGGSTYIINNYNRQAAAITRAMFQLRRATGIDRRMGVMA